MKYDEILNYKSHKSHKNHKKVQKYKSTNTIIKIDLDNKYKLNLYIDNIKYE